MPSDVKSMTVKALRFLVNQIDKENDDKEVGVLMPHYGRVFPIMAMDELDPNADYAKDRPESFVLIAHRRPNQ